MVCTEYQERLNELALAGSAALGFSPEFSGEEAGDPALDQHLSGCAGCREELERRRTLLARIDSGVAAMVAVEPSPALAVLVRQQIAEESAASKSFAHRWRWLVGATAAAAAIAVTVLTFTLRSPIYTPAQSPNTSPVQTPDTNQTMAAAPLNHASPSAVRANPLSTIVSRAVTELRREVGVQLPRVTESGAPSLEVLIPANEHVALVQLAVAAAHDQLDERVLVRAAATSAPEAIDVKPLKIDSLEDWGSQQEDGSKKLH